MKLVWNICDICLLYLYCLISISGIINVDWTWHTFTVFNGLHTYDAPYRVPQECQIGYSQVVYRCTVCFADSRKNWRANMSHSQYSGINTAIQKIYWLTTYAAKISIKLNGIFNHVQPEGSQDCQCPQRWSIVEASESFRDPFFFFLLVAYCVVLRCRWRKFIPLHRRPL